MSPEPRPLFALQEAQGRVQSARERLEEARQVIDAGIRQVIEGLGLVQSAYSEVRDDLEAAADATVSVNLALERTAANYQSATSGGTDAHQDT